LRAALGHSLRRDKWEVNIPTELDLVAMRSPFTKLVTVSMRVSCDDDTLGFELDVCEARSCVFIFNIKLNSNAAKIRNWCRKFKGAYIVEVDKILLFTQSDASRLVSTIRDMVNTNTNPMFTVFLAPDHPPLKAKFNEGIPRLQMDQFHTTILSLYEIGEGRKMRDDETPHDGELFYVINAVNSAPGPGTQWTRRQMKLPRCWPEWYKDEKVQLNQMWDANMFGKPKERPQNYVVLRSVWTYNVNHGGRKKARTCCDGSILRSPTLKYAQHCLSACIIQTGMKLFFSCLATRC
jgi:hypothetical protein